jgi:hypothetical protein
MAHFAQLDFDNNVLRVIVIDNSFTDENDENVGIEFLKSLYGQDTIWKQTSYNTRGGIYYNATTNIPTENQSKSFRKNFAGVGYKYDLIRDAFINPKPEVAPDFEQYVRFDEFDCLWKFEPPQNL